MFCRLVDEELSLELLTLESVDELFLLTDSSRDFLTPWLPWVSTTRSTADTRSFIVSALSQFARQDGFQTGLRVHGRLAGVVGLHGIDWSNRRTSIGYWLGSEFEGRGLMTRAVRAVIDMAFSDYQLNRVEIRAALENHTSCAISERLGFRQEGIIRDAEWLHDHFVDHAVYGLLRREWPPGGMA